MSADKRNIMLTLVYQDEDYPVQTYFNEYFSLMTLISEHVRIPGFGLCSGMGSCGTCLVMISNKYTSVAHTVMACTVPVTDELSNTQIAISDRRY